MPSPGNGRHSFLHNQSSNAAHNVSTVSSNKHNTSSTTKFPTSNANNPAPMVTSSASNVLPLREVRILPDLQLSQNDFEKRFVKSNEKCLNKCDFYETWKYEMNGDPYIVKKYLRLDDQKWKKLVNSYNLQYHLATVSSFFIKPYRLVSYSVMVAPNSSNSLGQRSSLSHGSNNTLQPGGQQQQQQQLHRRQQLYVIYQYQSQCIPIQSIFNNPLIEVTDMDILSLTVQLFRIGQECAAKNFPLINWKFSNLFVGIKQAKSQLGSVTQGSASGTTSVSTSGVQQQTSMLKSQRQMDPIIILPAATNSDSQSKTAAATTTTTTTAPTAQKICDSSLQIMDLYDYFGIENRDNTDPLLPPELSQDLRVVSNGNHGNTFEDYQGNLESSSIFMTGMILTLLLRMKYPQFVVKDTSNAIKKQTAISGSNGLKVPGISAVALISGMAKRRLSSVSFLPTLEEVARQGQASSDASRKSLAPPSFSSIPGITGDDQDTSVKTMNAFMEALIKGTALKDPLVNALAMIVKVTISENPMQRPTFAQSLDVVRDVFGEMIDAVPENNNVFTHRNNGKKYSVNR